MKKLKSIYEKLRLALVITTALLVISGCSNKGAEKCKKETTNPVNSPQKVYTQFVFETTNLYRYKFPTHINDIIVDRAKSENSEVFMVIVEDGKSVHHHKHADTEQIFYMIEGSGILSIGENKEESPVKPGDVVRIPPRVLHSIRPNAGQNIKYLCVDCFGTEPRLEPSWDEHVRVVCKEQGYDYKEIISSNVKK